MILPWISTSVPLPIVPTELLKRYHVHERHDTRFRSCARLLQALWLSDRAIPVGVHRGRRASRKLGSRLTPSAALAGRNFLSPELAELAHRLVAYQEPGAFLDYDRVLGNGLSSTTMCINLMGTLALDLDLAACVLRIVMPDMDIAHVDAVRFEHSPGRGSSTLTGDRSAFDACVFLTLRSDAGTAPRRCVIAIETKYTEGLHESGPCEPGRYDDLAEASGLFREPYHAALRVNPLQQLFREHLLAQAAVMRGDWPLAVFMSVAPAANERVQRQADLYTAFLNPTLEGQVPFVHVTLDAFVAALEFAGAPAAAALYDRYLDFTKIDRLVDAALKQRVAHWPTAIRKSRSLKLIGA